MSESQSQYVASRWGRFDLQIASQGRVKSRHFGKIASLSVKVDLTQGIVKINGKMMTDEWVRATPIDLVASET